MTHAEMFQFILDNTVEIAPDSSGTWTNQLTNETYTNKYRVVINGIPLFGKDLVQAIEFYNENYSKS